jgi:hypothetical protein
MSKMPKIARILLVLLMISLLIIPGCGRSPGTSTSVITTVSGEVTMKKASSADWVKAEIKMEIKIGDAIKTGAEASAKITFFDGSTIELKANTQIEFTDLVKEQSKKIRMKQEIGETVSKVQKLVDSASRYEIETPAAVAAVRGSQMIVEVNTSGTTSVGNIEGSISVIAQGKEVNIPVGKHSTVVPGATPSQPTEGTTSLILTSRVYPDPTGDLFDSQSKQVSGTDYLDIQSSQIFFIDGKWLLRMELKGAVPEKDKVTANTLVEWNFMLDFDRNKSTGLSRPFISNDIGYDFLAQLSLENNAYDCQLLDLKEGTSEEIDYAIKDKSIEMIIPLTTSGDKVISSPPAIDWAAANIFYKDKDPRDQPSFTDKAPNEGHYVFTPSQTAYSAVDDFSIANGNPNGVWSYGWMPVDFSKFNLYVDHTAYQWYGPLGGDLTPCIWINNEGVRYGVPGGWLSLHPGPGTEPSVLRWTSPKKGKIQVTGQFLTGDSGRMSVSILHNSAKIWNATDSGNFDLPLEVTSGDTINFIVYGGYGYGNTPISANISYK